MCNGKKCYRKERGDQRMKFTDYQNEYPLATDYLNRVREADARVQWLWKRANSMRMCLKNGILC